MTMPESEPPALSSGKQWLVDFLLQGQVTRRGTNADGPLAGGEDPFAFFRRPVLKLARRDVKSDVAGFTFFQVHAIEPDERAHRELHAIGCLGGRAKINLRHFI